MHHRGFLTRVRVFIQLCHVYNTQSVCYQYLYITLDILFNKTQLGLSGDYVLSTLFCVIR